MRAVLENGASETMSVAKVALGGDKGFQKLHSGVCFIGIRKLRPGRPQAAGPTRSVIPVFFGAYAFSAQRMEFVDHDSDRASVRFLSSRERGFSWTG